MMKKLFLIAALMLGSVFALFAQDKITTKDGTKIVARITKEDDATIHFKYWNNLNGPTLTLSKEDIASIKYANGNEVVFGMVEKASSEAVDDSFAKQPKEIKNKDKDRDRDKKKVVAEKKEKKEKESKKKAKKDDPDGENPPAPKFHFQLNDDGDPCIMGSFDYDCSSETAWRRLTSYTRSTFTSDSVEFEEDEDAWVLKITGAKEASKMRINPLIVSGFGDDVWYTLTFTQPKKGEIQYVVSDMSINSQAVGLANYSRVNSIRTMVRDYEKAKNNAANPDLSKKERNSAADTAKDLESSLTKAYETVMKRVDSICKNVQ